MVCKNDERWRSVYALLGVALACRSAPPTPTAPASSTYAEAGGGDVNEEVVRIPLTVHPGMTLEGTVFGPSGQGLALPLVVINHGSIGKRDPSPRWRPMALVQWFASRGFVVAVPMRRGHANSDGEWAEGYGPCATADYTNANLEAASDIHAAVTFMATRPNVDAKHALLVGVSTGGFSVLALASASPRWDGVNILGAIDFAGGRGSLSSDGNVTRYNCAPEALVAAAAGFGQAMTIPSLWLYADNDRYFPPPLAHQMFAAFSAHNSLGAFVQLPPFGVEGHSAWQSATWESDVTRFIDRIGIKMPERHGPAGHVSLGP